MILAGIAVGAAWGFLNALIIVYGKLNPIIVTLATNFIGVAVLFRLRRLLAQLGRRILGHVPADKGRTGAIHMGGRTEMALVEEGGDGFLVVLASDGSRLRTASRAASISCCSLACPCCSGICLPSRSPVTPWSWSG